MEQYHAALTHIGENLQMYLNKLKKIDKNNKDKPPAMKHLMEAYRRTGELKIPGVIEHI